jgi:hypothetical protein
MFTLLSLHQDTTTLGFGSEFRPIDQMEKILGQHPNFEFFADMLVNRMDYPFTSKLSAEDKRKTKFTAMIHRGNHQSVKEDSKEVAKLLAKDVLHGFVLPVVDARQARRAGIATNAGTAHAQDTKTRLTYLSLEYVERVSPLRG